MSTRLFSLTEAAALAGISGPTMTRRLRHGSGPAVPADRPGQGSGRARPAGVAVDGAPRRVAEPIPVSLDRF